MSQARIFDSISGFWSAPPGHEPRQTCRARPARQAGLSSLCRSLARHSGGEGLSGASRRAQRARPRYA